MRPENYQNPSATFSYFDFGWGWAIVFVLFSCSYQDLPFLCMELWDPGRLCFLTSLTLKASNLQTETHSLGFFSL